MAGDSSNDGGGKNITVAWHLQSKPTLTSEEQPLAHKPLGKCGKGTGGKGAQQACSYRAPLPLHFECHKFYLISGKNVI